MRKRILYVLTVLILFPAITAVISAENNLKKTTVMVYMCGSNLESKSRQGTKAIDQMIQSRFNTEEINVVLLLGGSYSWGNDYDTKVLTLLELGGRQPRIVNTLPLTSMGDPQTLTNFLQICYDQFPAENYILEIWDHGGGPVLGVCLDSLFTSGEPGKEEDEMLSAAEMAEALAASPFSKNPLDLIIFSCCLMGSAEFSMVLSPYARYMAATEDLMYGLRYDWLTGMENDTDILDTAIRMTDSSFEYNVEITKKQHATGINSFSIIDLDKMQNLSNKADSFFSRIRADLNDTSFTAMSSIRRNSAAFGSGTFDLIDLMDLAEQHREEAPVEADTLVSAIRESVVYQRTDSDKCGGLTVYHPFENKEKISRWLPIHSSLGFSDNYSSYLRHFSELLTGVPLADWTDLTPESASPDKALRMLFRLPLSENQAAHYGKSGLLALHRKSDDTFTFTYRNDATSLEDGQVSGELVRNTLYVETITGTRLSDELEYGVDKQGIYRIPAVLIRHEKQNEEEMVHQVLILCDHDKLFDELRPVSILVWEEALGGYTTAYNTEFSDYDEIILTTVSRRETRSGDGTLLPFTDWDIADKREWRIPIDKSWVFSEVNGAIDPESLYITFQIEDSQNNTWSSELLAAKSSRPDVMMRLDYDDSDLVLITNLKIDIDHSNTDMRLILNIKNLTETETVILLDKVFVNNVHTELETEGFGSGENWGLLPGEKAIITLELPAEMPDTYGKIRTLSFNLTPVNAETGEPIGSVPVSISIPEIDEDIS